MSAGSLTPGLTLNPTTGQLTGTPTSQGTFNFTVQVTDTGTGGIGTRAYSLAISSSFVQSRTREVIGNFIASRANQLTQNEPSRFRDHRRHSGTLFGGPSGNPVVTGSTGAAGPPIAFSVSPDQSGNVGRLAFATSLKQLLAKRDDAPAPVSGAAADRPDGMMALGVTSSRPAPYLAASPFDLWFEGYATHFENDRGGDSGSVGLLYAGAEYEVRPGLLIGALLQYDVSEQRSSLFGSNVKGHGWMAGPYLSARLTEHVSFDARAAWGRSDNAVSPFGTYIDNVDGERWLARAELSGRWTWDAWRFSPSIAIAFFEETIESYIDSNNVPIAGQTYRLGRLNFGPEIGYAIPLSDGSVFEPMLSIQGIWDFEGSKAVTFDGLPGGTPELRAKIQAGATLIAPWGYSVRASGFVDGVGADDYKAYGGQLMINMPFK